MKSILLTMFKQVDKLQHILACLVMMRVLQQFMPIYWAIAVTLIIALGKEFIYDKLLKKGCFEVKDMIADVIGVIIGLI